MVHVERTFTVQRPLGSVVEYLSDFSRAEAWDPGTISCTKTSDGPVDVGTTWKNVSKFLGRETELTYRLIHRDPNRLTFEGRNKTATSTDDIEFTAVGSDRTTITYRAHIQFHGAARLADPLLKLEFERLGSKTATQMSDALTSAPTM